MGVTLDIARGRDPDGHGPLSAVVFVRGAGADAFIVRWQGTLKWVCKSPVRPTHKRKNWFIGCFELDDEDDAVEGIANGDVRFEAFRAGGPGGQHQNATDSAVRATHLPTGLSVVARDQRSQHRNRADALRRLQALLRAAQDLAGEAERSRINASHRELQRGNPVRTFEGEGFREV